VADPIIIPTQETQLGSEIEHNDIKLKVDIEFTQGKDAKASNYKYFMNSPKGVYGLKEIE